jgi:hypothetical protein
MSVLYERRLLVKDFLLDCPAGNAGLKKAKAAGRNRGLPRNGGKQMKRLSSLFALICMQVICQRNRITLILL